MQNVQMQKVVRSWVRSCFWFEKSIFIMCVFVGWAIGISPVFAAGPTLVPVTISEATTWKKVNNPYIVSSSVTVSAPLTIESGVIVKFKNNSSSLLLASELMVQGTESESAIFTTVCDSSIGGDTRNFGSRCGTKPLAGEWGGISVTNNAVKADISYANIRYATIGVSYQTTNLTIPFKKVSVRNSTIESSSSAGIRIRNTVPVVDSNIIKNTSLYGVDVISEEASRVPVLRNNWLLNNRLGVRGIQITGASAVVDAAYNWWGDASGPYYNNTNDTLARLNPSGKGNGVDGKLLEFRPWLTDPTQKAPTTQCTEKCYSSILFLPGLEASRLYSYDDQNCLAINCENQLWEPNRSEDVRKMYQGVDGKDVVDIYTKDILDEVRFSGHNIYKSFVQSMNVMRDDARIQDWAAIPYDWRHSAHDIVNNGVKIGDKITYKDQQNSPYLIAELRRLAQTSKSGKVTIIAHSNGGIVAKTLLQQLGDEESKKLVDVLILVAVPQVGTPAAMAAGLHGYDQDHLGGLLVSKSVARGLLYGMPSAYALLPSAAYFVASNIPLIFFDEQKLPEWVSRYGKEIQSLETLKNFLTDTFGRVAADNADTQTPTSLSNEQLQTAIDSQNILNSWVPPSELRVIQVAGTGIPSTVAGLSYTTKTEYSIENGARVTPHDSIIANPLFTQAGDGTVVEESAIWLHDVERIWVNLRKLNTEKPLALFSGMLQKSHADILEIPELLTYITNTIQHVDESSARYQFLSKDMPEIHDTYVRISMHSPMTLDMYDDAGRHTGVNAQGVFEEQIPGTYYRRYGDVQYIFANTTNAGHLKMKGLGVGTFTLKEEVVKDDAVVQFIGYQDVITDEHMTATTDIQFGEDSLLQQQSLSLDTDSNGEENSSIQSVQNALVTYDDSAPVSTHEYFGTKGNDGWFLSEVRLVLSAYDYESGIQSIQYSLDGGAQWSYYTEPIMITQQGETKVVYRSINTQGFKELSHELVFLIDTVAPEVWLSLNPQGTIDVVKLSDQRDSVVRDANGIIVSDVAGHTL